MRRSEHTARSKRAITDRPIQHLSDHDKTLILRTDVSEEGIGAISLQEHEGQSYLVNFASKKLLD